VPILQHLHAFEKATANRVRAAKFVPDLVEDLALPDSAIGNNRSVRSPPVLQLIATQVGLAQAAE
jgi:hypothetical protein